MGLSSKVAPLDGPEYWSQELEITSTFMNNTMNDSCKNNRNKDSNPNSSNNKNYRQPQQQLSPPLQCPRCESNNTKFCYYNNYSRLQPRHFCKACKRHWTAGGTLRNVPVGGERKTKRPKTRKTSSTSTSSTENIILASSNASGEQEINIRPFERPFNDIFPHVVPQLQLASNDYSLDTEFRHSDMMSAKESINTMFSSSLYPSGLMPDDDFVRIWGGWYENMASSITSEFDMNL